jgi:hypothetical protein
VRSRWFGSAVAVGGGLRLPGRPADHAASLHLGRDGVVLRMGTASARLEWECHRASGAFGSHDDGNWWLTSFARGRAGPIGIAIGVERDAAAVTAGVRAATRTLRNRFHRLLQDDAIVPLRATGWARPGVAAERDTLSALCRALAERPAMRSRLADPACTRRLVRAMADRPLLARPEVTAGRRDTTEVLGALRALGYRHLIGGRPLPGDLPALDLVVDQVFERLGHDPYARDVRPTRSKVAQIVRRHFLDVEPWPFEGLR